MTNSVHGTRAEIKLRNLLLDPENPRLGETYKNASQEDLAIAIDLGSDALTVAQSIARHGYFAAEPMIVIPVPGRPNDYYVVEGNRRLTALKGLTNEAFRNKFIEVGKWNELSAISSISEDIAIPVVVSDTRQAVVPVIGWRHIAGILAWKPYMQAMYVADLIDQQHLDFAEVANAVGIKKSQVVDLYRERRIAQQAKAFDLDTSGLEASFSLLTVAMRNPNIRNFVGVPVGANVVPGEDPVPTEKIGELKEILGYIFGNEDKDPVISDSREMTKLGNVIASQEALATLRSGKTLTEALSAIPQVSVDPLDRLKKRLNTADNSLKAALEDWEAFSSNDDVNSLLSSIESTLNSFIDSEEKD